MKIYIDNYSTTPVFKEVVDEMRKCMNLNYGNPSSVHSLGEKAFEVLKNCKKRIAEEINSSPEEIIFTSGGTEGNNLALMGIANSNNKKNKIIISRIEHPSVSQCADFLESKGYRIVKIDVNESGELDMKMLENEIDGQTLMVSVMHVNNIIGSIQNIEKIGEICRNKGVYFHTDAVQSFGKIKIDVKKMKIDFLTGSGHKIGASKGIGFLYIRKGIEITPSIYGGGQENGIRSGTQNVPGIAGFTKALQIIKKIDKNKVEKSRNKLIEKLESIGGKVNGGMKNRIYNNIHIRFEGIKAEYLVQYLSEKGIYVSSGSACESKKRKEDEVLRAIGIKDGMNSIRLSLLNFLKDNEINYIVKNIKNAINAGKV